jgi:hypothetical protein
MSVEEIAHLYMRRRIHIYEEDTYVGGRDCSPIYEEEDTYI